MKMLPTLVNRNGLRVHLEAMDLPGGKATPPYFLQYKGRLFLIDPEHWDAGTETKPLIAAYNEMQGHECLNVDQLKQVQKKEVAA